VLLTDQSFRDHPILHPQTGIDQQDWLGVLVLLAQLGRLVLRQIYFHDMLRLVHDVVLWVRLADHLVHDVVLWVLRADHLAAQVRVQCLHLAFD
jgi:hypothetical protein